MDIDATLSMSRSVGKEHGLAPGRIEQLYPELETLRANMLDGTKQHQTVFMQLPHDRDSLPAVKDLAGDIRKRAEHFVVLGVGGAALGSKALQSSLRHSLYNTLSADARGGPTMHFLDNVDPDQTSELLNWLDLKKTVFNVITKSGSTTETMSHFLLFRQALADVVGEANLAKHLVVTTDPEKGMLRSYTTDADLRSLPIPTNLGGRFSVFSAVGLLPAAVAGIDIDELLEGARLMDTHFKTASPGYNMVFLNTALHYLMLTENNRTITVLMPYAYALRDIADWFRQLWAESLAKKQNITGSAIKVGLTPVKSLGATDQHSQLQLYMEGPPDKYIVFLGVNEYRSEIIIPPLSGAPESLAYLGGCSMANLIQAEQRGTELALAEAGCPSCTITLASITPRTIGALLYTLQLTTAMMGGLLHINPYDQPGVEGSKRITYALMGRPGYDQIRNDLAETEVKLERHQITVEL